MSKRSEGSPAMRRRPPCRDFGRDPRSQELAKRIVARAGQIAALEGEQLAEIAELNRAEAWRGDGAVSMASWLTQQCGIGAGRARQWARAASKLEALPKLSEGLESGTLSLDMVAPLAEVATPETDGSLAAEARHLSVQQARELVEWQRAVRESEAKKLAPSLWSAARDYEHRTLRFNDEGCSIWAAFTKDDYAEAKAVLTGALGWGAAKGSVGLERGGSDAMGYVPMDQRLYDGFMEVLRAVGGRAGARGRCVPPKVVVHAPLEVLMGTGAGVAEIEGVGPIPAEVARRLACEASITVSVERADGCILDQGRARKEPTPAQRIEIERRDKGCRFPGCMFRAFTHVHHIRHWADGGRTDQANLITLCGRHHRAVHELGWKMDGDADGVMVFTSPAGRRMSSVPSPTWRRPVPKGSRLRR